MRGTNNEIVLEAGNRVLGQMLLIAKIRKVDMMEVLSYYLGLKQWALAKGDGSMKKTDKAILEQYIRKEGAYIDSIYALRTMIYLCNGISAENAW